MNPFKIRLKVDNLIMLLAKANLVGVLRENKRVCDHFGLVVFKKSRIRSFDIKNRKATFWIKPKPPEFKLNFTCHLNNGRVGAGFVLKDSIGQMHYEIHLNFAPASAWEAYLKGAFLAI
ncbi:hypothetical protein KSP40_PGU021645 [Platanthera guangdongensis]|uniref:Uncharacterized protein n=1 Tax=Platanthera guangdongensis TaxID=2320717 RepID=A0ABR2MBH8_9ASPA